MHLTLAQGNQLNEIFKKNWPVKYPQGLGIPSTEIKSLQVLIPDTNFTDGDVPLETLEQALRSYSSNLAFDPLTRRSAFGTRITAGTVPGEFSDRLRDSFEKALQIAFRPRDLAILVELSDHSPARLLTAIEHMIHRTQQGTSDVFAAKPFDRVKIIKEIVAELGATGSVEICCDTEQTPGFPAVTEDSGTSSSSDQRLEVFREYCGACHATPLPDPPNFLFGSDTLVLENLKNRAEKILERLDWERMPPPANPMPPPASSFGTKLRAPENDSKRQEMRVTLSALKEP